MKKLIESRLCIFMIVLVFISISSVFAEEKTVSISPTLGVCQDDSGGWAAENCDGDPYEGSESCDSDKEYTFCDDDLIESQSTFRNNVAGARMFFEDDTYSYCENVLQVEMLYKVWWEGDDRGARDISIDADETGWTPTTFTIDFTEPTNTRVRDITGEENWSCNDFFNSSAPNAGLETKWSPSGGNPSNQYTVKTDVLHYRVLFNFTTTPIFTDKSSYAQKEVVVIDSEPNFWNSNQNIILNITRSDSTIDTINTSTNSTGKFNTTYSIGDYYSIGEYEIYGEQQNDSSKNSTDTFQVEKRTPSISANRNFYAPGETIQFDGSQFADSTQINFSKFNTFMFEDTNARDIFNSTSQGGINYNYTFSQTPFLKQDGIYTFNFSEIPNASYFREEGVDFVFRPNSSTDDLSLINKSDDNDLDVDATSDFTMEQFFPNSTNGINVSSVSLYLEYETNGGANRILRWFNQSSGAYEDVCSLPDTSGEDIYQCDITSEAKYLNGYNSMDLRLFEDGGGNDDFFIDFIYLQRNFTVEPPKVNLISPVNSSNITLNQPINFTYNVSSPYSIDRCSLYINQTEVDNDSSITKNTQQNFYYNTSIPVGNHTWSVGCREDSSEMNSGNSSQFNFTIEPIFSTISLIGPANNSKFLGNGTPTVEFSWFVGNQTINNTCDVVINGNIENSGFCEGNTTNSLNLSIPSGKSYNKWYVNVTNDFGLTTQSNSSFYYNIVEKHLGVQKNIFGENTDQYSVEINITNYKSYNYNYTFLDFVEDNFNLGSETPSFSFVDSIIGEYIGKIYGWNLTTNQKSVNYSLASLDNYNVSSLYIVGLE